MKRLLLPAFTLALLSMALGAYAAQPAVSLPIVGARAQMNVSITTLIESDSTFVGVARDSASGRIILTYIDRAHGNRLHVVEDKGDRVAELELPPIGVSTSLAGAVPSFTTPGDKQADGVPLIAGTTLHIYFTSRDEGDPDGPFRLKRLTMPLPPPEAP